eukprot:CAMPEP_0177651180 /NCGR_PEP_ID=MMETSP0447-20121125/12388_1 /TAXON_ID=0 /ORGANISM="Stygamoeba regulata, Strain BSH-02190019" /LENGTH=719 /DNA_ID=CAMNT_0019154199 /DNA_START=226 /DNA_END=2385 /DNA_ORIENTATION=-
MADPSQFQQARAALQEFCQSPAGSRLNRDDGQRVAISVVGEESLVHFDMSQAFAWEYLRKKQRITREDLDMAEKLQREEEERLREEVKALRQQRRPLGDSTLALKLSEELATAPSLPDRSWRSDSAFAFALMNEERMRAEKEQQDALLAKMLADDPGLNLEPDQDIQFNYNNGPPTVAPPVAPVSATFRCFSHSALGDASLECSSRIVLPPVALDSFKDVIPAGGEPLLLRITNAMWQGRETVVGCASFSAPDGVMLVPAHIMEEVRVCDGDAVQLLPSALPKVTRLKFQPIHSDFLKVNNPKVALEAALNERYPTLSVGSPVVLKEAGQEHVLVVVSVEPADTVCTVNANPEIEFDEPRERREPEHAVLKLNEKPVNSTVTPEKSHLYWFATTKEDEDLDLIIEVEAVRGDPDLYISQTDPHPSQVSHLWSAASTGGDEIRILADDELRKVPGTFFVAVCAWKEPSEYRIAVMSVNSRQEATSSSISLRSSVTALPSADHTTCLNCLRPVPAHNLSRHLVFCRRNNYRCTLCSKVMRTQDQDKHWHCPACQMPGQPDDHVHCEKCSRGMNRIELEKHLAVSHTKLECECHARFELAELLLHKEFECPKRAEQCSFCKATILSEALREHLLTCGAKHVTCEKCDKELLARELPFHVCSSAAPSSELGFFAPDTQPSAPRVHSTDQSWRHVSSYLCPYCGGQRPSWADLESHMPHCDVSL